MPIRNKFAVFCHPEDIGFHNIFNTGDWDLKRLTNFFGDIETILANVLHRRSCPVEVVRLLISNGANVNCHDKYDQSPLTIAVGVSQNEAVIRELLEAGADINIGENGESLLLHYLGRFYDNDCDIGVVRLLLSYDPNINAVNAFGNSPLVIALQCSRDKEIIQALLEKGARVDMVNSNGKSPLCLAFQHSSDVAKLLLDAGAHPNTCTYHKSPFYCLLEFAYSDLREDVINHLLEANADLNIRNEHGQSVLCFAIHHGSNASNIRLLLNLGASLNACRMHSSALRCATSSDSFSHLKKDRLQVLLDNGATVNGKGLKVLQHALYFRDYETGAIKLLLELPGMDEYISTHKSILHVALRGRSCNLDTVILLIKHNVHVNGEDEMKNTPLHVACKNRCDPSIIKFLIKKSARVNATNNREETPLMIVMENKPCHIATLKELLLHGALIGTTMFRVSENEKCGLPEILAREWERSIFSENSDKLIKNKMLLKFFLLQNPELTFEDMQHYPAFAIYNTINLEIFFNECLIELVKLDSLLVCNGYTFRMIVKQDLYLETIYDFNLLLIYLSKNSFPIYFDVISSRIDRSFMEAQLYKLRVSTNKIDPVDQVVILHNDVVLKIAKYLADDDVLNFILASYVSVQLNDIDRDRPNSFQPGKRKCQAITKLSKCIKLEPI